MFILRQIKEGSINRHLLETEGTVPGDSMASYCEDGGDSWSAPGDGGLYSDILVGDKTFTVVDQNGASCTNVLDDNAGNQSDESTAEYSVPHKRKQIVHATGDGVQQASTSMSGYDVMPHITDANGEYDKLHVYKRGHDVSAANVYDHVSPNTESTYDKLALRPAPNTRSQN